MKSAIPHVMGSATGNVMGIAILGSLVLLQVMAVF